MRQELVIEGTLPSLNDYIDACRVSKKRGGEFKRETDDLICWTIKAAHLKPMGKVNVHVQWIEPNMKRDKDNIRASVKFILDSLKKMGVIKNDGWRWIGEITDSYSVNRKHPRVIVTLEEV